MFKVTVIIPVYNREKFIERCVKSALELSQVGEILLIDDGSSDNSNTVCEELTHQNPKVKLLTHPNKANRGVSASRNLGIAHANFEFISFLDSDDYFLPNRFQKDEHLFLSKKEVNVSYSLSQIKFENGKNELFGTTINSNEINPKENFYEFVLEQEIILGHISSVTFRRSIFYEIDKWFDVRLKLHEDTEFWNRVSRNYFFSPSEIENPVSVYLKHDSNSIKTKAKMSELRFLVVFIDNIGIENLFEFEKKYIISHFSRALSNPIKNHVLRKFLFHGINQVSSVFKNSFVHKFYNWGLIHFKLKL